METKYEDLDPEALRRYIIRRHADLVRFRESLKTSDYALIQNLGHNLKGNGSSFGFPELSQLGAQIEASAKATNFEETKKLVDQFEAWVHQQKFF